MKSVLLAIAIVLSSLFANAQVKFFDGSYMEAAKKAKEEKKYLFVDCYTDWCHWCKVADKTTFASESVSTVLNRAFVSVKVDMERGEGIELGMKYRVFGYPTFLVFDSEGRLVFSQFGYIKDELEFVETLKEGVFGENRKRKFGSNIYQKVEFPKFYKATFTDADSNKKREFVEREVVTKWLATQKDIASEVAWAVYRRFTTEDKANAMFFGQLDVFKKRYGEDEVNEKIIAIASESLAKILKKEGSSEDDLKPTYQMLEKFLPKELKEETLARFRLRFAEKNEDWGLYSKAANQLLGEGRIKSNPGQANSIAWTLYLKCNDITVLEEAVNWMELVVKVDPSYAYMDTYAALLYKTEDYESALINANKAVEIGLASDEKVTETEELVEKIKAAQKRK